MESVSATLRLCVRLEDTRTIRDERLRRKMLIVRICSQGPTRTAASFLLPSGAIARGVGGGMLEEVHG